ncbi:MAG: toll/interleukin-1 receptor domain-containing protein [Pseudomonadota bacterium]
MSGAPQAVFIGYRRADTADVAGRLFDRLEDRFGEKSVFKDVDSIPIGASFREYVPQVIAKCRVFLALIGPDWLKADQGAARRLDDPQDLVRIEIETALAATPRLTLVPVLVNGATAPTREVLPPSIQGLADLNAATLRRDPDFSGDVEKLLKALAAFRSQPPDLSDPPSPRRDVGSATSKPKDQKLTSPTSFYESMKANLDRLDAELPDPLARYTGNVFAPKVDPEAFSKTTPEQRAALASVKDWNAITKLLAEDKWFAAVVEFRRQTNASSSDANAIIGEVSKFRRWS